MTVSTLQVANRLKAAEREGRAAEELALVLGEIEADRCQSLVTREHLAFELERLWAATKTNSVKVRYYRAVIGFARSYPHNYNVSLNYKSSLRDQFELMERRLVNSMTWRFGWMMVAFVVLVGATEVFF